jgi:thiol peroxidase
MKKRKYFLIWFSAILLVLFGYLSAHAAGPTVNKDSVEPGSKITLKGKPLMLMGTPIIVGKPLPPSVLTDPMKMKGVDLSSEKGSVLFLSIVPSLDTAVCEAQTHYLGEEGDRMPPSIQRITISRDTPFAQKRFAKEAKLENIRYLSDYKEGDFGRSTGLLIDDLRLLARTVVLVDKQGIVRYIQVVPEFTNLPDMDTAFEQAIQLDKEN